MTTFYIKMTKVQHHALWLYICNALEQDKGVFIAMLQIVSTDCIHASNEQGSDWPWQLSLDHN